MGAYLKAHKEKTPKKVPGKINVIIPSSVSMCHTRGAHLGRYYNTCRDMSTSAHGVLLKYESRATHVFSWRVLQYLLSGLRLACISAHPHVPLRAMGPLAQKSYKTH